ncbi:hypothetical protein JCM10908_005968 [Rhodotorula pacifica]|uniref:peroxiredoxin n=1 Tax=Rhodotorula pacifica TaxID=1495444 RepID=UPI00316B0876
MPSTRGTNAPRRSKRVTEAEKQQAKVKAQQAAKAAKQTASKKATAAAKKVKSEVKDKDAAGVVADVKKKAGKAVKEVKSKVVKPAAKKVAKAAGVSTSDDDKKPKKAATKTKKATSTATAPKKTAAAAPKKKKTTSSTTKAVSAPKPAPKKRGPPKARGAADDKKPAAAKKAAASKKEETAAAHYKVGDVVEDVTLQNEDDKPITLKSLYEDKHLVIFSYPKADTPGCTTQACGYRDLRSEYESLDATVIGLSTDKPTAQLKWKSKNELGYSLLSDPNGDLLLKKLGWSDKSKRSHWVIEKGGKLAEAKLGVKPADDPKNALEFLKSIKDSK